MSSTFKIGSNTQQAQMLLIDFFLRPWFHGSLTDLTDNSIACSELQQRTQILAH